MARADYISHKEVGLILTPKDFANKTTPYAQQMCDALGVPQKYAAVFVSQWAHESGYESDNWVGHNNYAGITNGGPPNFLKYDTISDFIMSQAWNLQNLKWAYNDFLQAMKDGKTVEQVMTILGQSPWDAGGYGVEYGLKPGALLLQRYDELQPYLPVTRETPPTPTWGVEEAKYLGPQGLKIFDVPADLDKPVTYRWVITVLARIISRFILKDGRF